MTSNFGLQYRPIKAKYFTLRRRNATSTFFKLVSSSTLSTEYAAGTRLMQLKSIDANNRININIVTHSNASPSTEAIMREAAIKGTAAGACMPNVNEWELTEQSVRRRPRS